MAILDVLIPVLVCGLCAYSAWAALLVHREVDDVLDLLDEMQREDPLAYGRFRDRWVAIRDRAGRS